MKVDLLSSVDPCPTYAKPQVGQVVAKRAIRLVATGLRVSLAP